jgi:hypothetical protein
MDLEKMTSLTTTKWKVTIINMNKDQKLIAESYSKVLRENARRSAAGLDMDGLMADQERYERELDKKEAYKDSLQRHNENPRELDSTVDLEAIADFLNDNEVWSGSPAKGSGGWYVNNSFVTNDDAEGGYSGISVSFVPGDSGLTAYDNESGAVQPIKFEWPVSAQALEKYMQSKSSRL